MKKLIVAMADTHTATPTLTHTALALSSGTFGTLTDVYTYTALDRIQQAFVLWCQAQPNQTQTWQDAWAVFWAQHARTPIWDLAQAITTAGTNTPQQIQESDLSLMEQ